MDPTTLLTAILLPFLGPRAALWAGATIAFVMVFGFIGGQVMPYLTVADAMSPTWYRIVYGLLARSTGNHGRNAPVPLSGMPAGGIVPAPPAPPP